MIAESTFVIPPEIEARLLAGELNRYGSVVRDTAGRIVVHLKEISLPEPNGDVVEAAARLLNKPIVIAGFATLAVVGTAVTIARKRKQALPECAKNDNESRRVYLAVVRDQSLDDAA
ncbi:hypothetical protein AB0N89_07120 [Amycolatopsis sp. NPDC089917]|uniref:hypothetical protein n=1 Tax=Amycolatopsis sp. NPDC089917 TaxID=3155187 RepID=UPI0034468FFD